MRFCFLFLRRHWSNRIAGKSKGDDGHIRKRAAARWNQSTARDASASGSTSPASGIESAQIPCRSSCPLGLVLIFRFCACEHSRVFHLGDRSDHRIHGQRNKRSAIAAFSARARAVLHSQYGNGFASAVGFSLSADARPLRRTILAGPRVVVVRFAEARSAACGGLLRSDRHRLVGSRRRDVKLRRPQGTIANRSLFSGAPERVPVDGPRDYARTARRRNDLSRLHLSGRSAVTRHSNRCNPHGNTLWLAARAPTFRRVGANWFACCRWNRLHLHSCSQPHRSSKLHHAPQLQWLHIHLDHDPNSWPAKSALHSLSPAIYRWYTKAHPLREVTEELCPGARQV